MDLHSKLAGVFAKIGCPLNYIQTKALELYKKKDYLIVSPTGSGKTLASFIGPIDDLIRNASSGTNVLYVAPLKALANDIEKNVREFLTHVNENFLTNFTIATRTGDTPSSERTKQKKNNPTVLCTTIESLSILLSLPKTEVFKDLKTIIVDEVHAICDNKRGTLMAFCLARLKMINPNLRTIGASATVSPLDQVCKFLFNNSDNEIILGNSIKKESDLRCILVEGGKEEDSIDIGRTASFILKSEPGTLVFSNTRHLVERLSQRINQLSDRAVLTHHASMTKEEREYVENRMKSGEIDIVLASSSLEQGIDINTIGRVIQISSPKQVARALQRAGRAGHRIGRITRADYLAPNADQAMEIGAILELARNGMMDSITIPQNCMDVAVQGVLSFLYSREKGATFEEVDQFIKTVAPYRNFTSTRIVLDYLLALDKPELTRWRFERAILREGRFLPTYGRKRIQFLKNIGVIVQQAQIIVKCDKRAIGTLDPDFAVYLTKGAIFALGGKNYIFQYMLGTNTAVVSEARRGEAIIPAWKSDTLPMTFEVGEQLQRMRFEILHLFCSETRKLREERIRSISKFGETSVKALYTHFQQQYLWIIGCYRREIKAGEIIVEVVKEQKEGAVEIVIHSCIGFRMNIGFALFISNRIQEILDTSISFSFSDKGIHFCLEETSLQGCLELLKDEAFFLADREKMYELISRNIEKTVYFRRVLRATCYRSLALLKGGNIAEYLVINSYLTQRGLLPTMEALRELVEDFFEFEKLVLYIGDIHSGKRKLAFPDEISSTPSPFAFNIFFNPQANLSESESLASKSFFLRSIDGIEMLKKTFFYELDKKTFLFERGMIKLFFEKKYIIISDVHLGLETTLEKNMARVVGMDSLSETKFQLNQAFEMDPLIKGIIIVGDLKDQLFRERSTSRILENFLNYLKDMGVERIFIVRGNHDSLLEEDLNVEEMKEVVVQNETDLEVLSPVILTRKLVMEDTLFEHGHRLFSEGYRQVIAGHQHPMEIFTNRNNVSQSRRCILRCFQESRELFTLPPFNINKVGRPIEVILHTPNYSKTTHHEVFIREDQHWFKRSYRTPRNE